MARLSQEELRRLSPRKRKCARGPELVVIDTRPGWSDMAEFAGPPRRAALEQYRKGIEALARLIAQSVADDIRANGGYVEDEPPSRRKRKRASKG